MAEGKEAGSGRKMNISAEEAKIILARVGAAPGQVRHRPAPRHSKYHNEPVVVDGIRFDSKREAACYESLKLQKLAGKIHYFLHQVPFRLPGGVIYKLDFLVFNNDGTMRYLDPKGVRTKVYQIKKRQVEAIYGIKIEEV